MDPDACRTCGRPNDRASSLDGSQRPGPGDLSICLSCGELSAFNPDLTLRPLTPEERADVEHGSGSDVTLVRRAVSLIHRRGRL